MKSLKVTTFIATLTIAATVNAAEVDTEFFSIFQQVEERTSEFGRVFGEAKAKSEAARIVRAEGQKEYFEAERRNNRKAMQIARAKVTEAHVESILAWGKVMDLGMHTMRNNIQDLEKVQKLTGLSSSVMSKNEKKKMKRSIEEVVAKNSIFLESVSDVFIKIENENSSFNEQNPLMLTRIDSAITKLKQLKGRTVTMSVSPDKSPVKEQMAENLKLYREKFFIVFETYASFSNMLRERANLTKVAVKLTTMALAVEQADIFDEEKFEETTGAIMDDITSFDKDLMTIMMPQSPFKTKGRTGSRRRLQRLEDLKM